MKRWPFALAVVALSSLLVAAAEQAAPSFDERLEAFHKQARAEREKAGLDRSAAKERYPTPELRLSGSAATEVCVAPGETAELAFAGKLPPGSLAGFQCEELEVLALSSTENKVSAKVRARPTALPRACPLTAVSALSAIQTELPAVRIAGSYRWELQFGNGWSSRWTWRARGCGSDGEAETEWRDQTKLLGTVAAHIDGQGRHWTANTPLAMEDQQAALALLQSPEARKDQAELMKISQAMGKECSKLEPAKLTPCFARYQELLKPVQERVQQRANQSRALQETRKVGCHRVRLEVEPDGKVKGRAEGCGAPGETTVSGKLSPLKT